MIILKFFELKSSNFSGTAAVSTSLRADKVKLADALNRHNKRGFFYLAGMLINEESCKAGTDWYWIVLDGGN